MGDIYFRKMLPELSKSGSNGENGFCAISDTKVLQALSKRVHHSMFLAEAKFRESPDLFEDAIKEQNAEKLRKLVTCSEANENTLRLKNREEIFGLFENQEKPFTMKLHLSAKLFDMYIVPLLIEVQVQYLLLKGKDDNLSSSAIRNMIRIKALSKTTQIFVEAEPSLAYAAKVIGILSLSLLLGARDRISEFLNKKGLAIDKSFLALLFVWIVTVKGAYTTLKELKIITELVQYYVKLLEKDKKEK